MKVLMVCLGNICRSPLAQGILEARAKAEGWDIAVDSAGTSDWHEGEPPDPRSIQVARQNQIDISHQRSRPVSPQDFYEYDVIFAMDKSNLNYLKNICPDPQQKDKLYLILGISHGPDEVPDPYYSGGFDHVFSLLDNACYSWLNEWKEKAN
jgi:protein-tyrosine phosphatase